MPGLGWRLLPPGLHLDAFSPQVHLADLWAGRRDVSQHRGRSGRCQLYGRLKRARQGLSLAGQPEPTSEARNPSVLAVHMRFQGLGFDDNIGGFTAGAQNVCMLAAFGDGGTVPESCVPIIGTQELLKRSSQVCGDVGQADEFNGNPEQHYFGMDAWISRLFFECVTSGGLCLWLQPGCISGR